MKGSVLYLAGELIDACSKGIASGQQLEFSLTVPVAVREAVKEKVGEFVESTGFKRHPLENSVCVEYRNGKQSIALYWLDDEISLDYRPDYEDWGKEIQTRVVVSLDVSSFLMPI